jgi:hypothetical protein
MNFGFQETHQIDTNMILITGQMGCERTIRVFIKPKGHNPFKWILSPFICTDIYLDENGNETHRELNLSFISCGIVMAGFIIFGIACFITFLSHCLPPA